MSRTRLAAAFSVAALTLGATVAAAETTTDTQEVTITVAAAARTVTAVGTTVDLTAVAGATAVSASDSSTAAVSYTNPAGNDPAKIEVSRDDTDLGALTLSVVAAGDEGDGEGAAAAAVVFATTGGTAANFITGIGASADVSGRAVTFTLGGDAGDARVINTTVTYTITGDDV
jgi:hypothetical protein